MAIGRIFLIAALVLFGAIGILRFVKKQKQEVQPVEQASVLVENAPIQVDLESLQIVEPVLAEHKQGHTQALDTPLVLDMLEDTDHIDLLFQKNSPLEIVETIQYKSRAPWPKLESCGRGWITGSQKSSPVAMKVMCIVACTGVSLNATS